ncbi:MAG: UDP-N-acetylglucosamine 2-epimerase [Kangiellaceae bacterium]|nr:UDP-N-acetylglucosamine 2-epimerase [Kangiellaceae bacterium]MCW8999745.1 UDP-N-acetylglucosamine 2-epimerase [Kangiellaceae bacterium]MCW9016890.1 UDP-N-acetylglucosamine 2-epimerase [Kangiellaceae bacterium]
MKTIGIVTGTRAEFGLLYRTIELLQKDESFDTRIFVCGAHLSPEYGYTISEIEQSNIDNIIRVEMLLSSSSKAAVAKSVGIATMSFADAFSREPLDGILVLGDRYEILAAAQAAMFLNIPLIHIHGGEVTEGAFDDSIRHAITKMANVHFPVTEEFAKRIMQLGESKKSIFVVGSPGIDNIINSPGLKRGTLQESLGFELDQPTALVTYHPVTKTDDCEENNILPLINAIKANSNLTYVVTYPNADGNGAEILKQWETIESLENVKLVPSLGFKRYLSLMEYVDCVIGNSSSGIIEAPCFKVGTINIGSRQNGRPMADSIINVSMDEKQISDAIKLCSNADFKKSLKDLENPYGHGGTAENIVDVLRNIELSSYHVKQFVDMKSE